MPKNAKALADEMEGMWARAEREGRDLTADERGQIEELIAAAKQQHGIEQQIKELGAGLGAPLATRLNGDAAWGGGPGDVFVKSAEYQRVKADRGQTWTTGPVEVSNGPLSAKGTLLQPGAGGPGGGLTPAYVEPGVVSKLFEPITVADVLGQSTTTASQVRYIVEGTATSGAAGVAEGGTKPESTLAFSEVVEPIKKIATVLPISDEMLEDAPSISSYLNGRLSLFVSNEEERQLLRGAGTNELVGLFNRSGINVYTRGTADNNLVALAKVIANTAGSAYLQPDTIVLHPTNWLSTRLQTDGQGQFYGGGPFTGAYGNAGATGMFGESIWNTRVVLSTHVGAGTALVGNFGQAAHIWRRSGVTVEATNAHQDYFVKNLSMIRAEERLGLGLYRPVAFTEVRGLV